ncbi:acyl-CoA carboxylase subunit epsilon [Streptomyces sp. NPDC102402]|uniref:acyl-CoA carboxylase subunit epsilon n=1 Tax=Streptomyces sp. NPDC102402 TaxID=3366169 RepID=UPI00381BDC86
MTTLSPSSTPCIRIEKGAATPEELAALTVLFLARAPRDAGTEADGPGAATSWLPDLFHAPHSWQAR